MDEAEAKRLLRYAYLKLAPEARLKVLLEVVPMNERMAKALSNAFWEIGWAEIVARGCIDKAGLNPLVQEVLREAGKLSDE